MNKNSFKLKLPDGMPVRDARLFNMKGQETATRLTYSDRNDIIVSFDKKTITSGSYVLKIKTAKGAFEHAFVY